MTQDAPRPGTLEHVEEAIRAWHTAIRDEDEDLLTGFVIAYSETSYRVPGDPLFRVRYCCSDGTDLVRAVGIMELGRQLLFEDASGNDADE